MKSLLLFVIIAIALLRPAVAQVGNASDWSHKFASPEAVLAGFRSKFADIGPKDPRSLFLQVYIQISEEMLVMLSRHEFKNEF